MGDTMATVPAVQPPQKLVRAPDPWQYRAQVVGEIATWQPPLGSHDVDIRPGFHLNRARARDLALSNPYAANSAEVIRDAVVGKKFGLAFAPNLKMLGVDPTSSEGEAWVADIEAEWEAYAEGITFDADVTRKSSFTLLMHIVQVGLHVDGEVLGLIRAKPGQMGYLTALQLIEPERLDDLDHSRLSGQNGNEVRYGIERDATGEPIAYHIRDAHPSEARWSSTGKLAEVRRIERFGPNGRPQVLHLFDETRPNMTRGVSREMLSTLKANKMLATYADAELSRQIQSASWAAVIESELNYEEVRQILNQDGANGFDNNLTAALTQHMSHVAGYYQEAGLRYNGSKIVHLVPGEQLKIVQSNIQGAQFEKFERAFLRQLSAGLGVSYEELARDFSDLSYAAARMSIRTIWNRYLRIRAMLCSKFAMPFFSAWLEEALLTKRMPVIGKLKANEASWSQWKHHVCQGAFVSWGMPIIDPVKEYTGKAIALALGLTTMQAEAAAEGRDWADDLEQRSREAKRREALDLNPGGVDPSLTIGGKGSGNSKQGNQQEARQARSDGPG